MSIPAILIVIILAGYMLFALIGNLLYWYETINSPESGIPSPRPGVFSCASHYAATLASYFICGLTFILCPFARRQVSAAEGQNSALPPLILVHGVFSNAGAWLYLGRRFRKAGFPVSTCSYHSFFTTFEQILQNLDLHIRAVETSFPGQKPLFICHSMGGIVVRRWLLDPKNQTRTGGVLTLGTPHKGSKAAALAPGKLIKNLLPSADLIRELADAPSLTLPCVALISPADEAVLPAANLLPPQGWRICITSRGGHFSMLFCPGTAQAVLQELQIIAEKKITATPVSEAGQWNS